uniref:Uncharacterized protein n=1 Tax=Clastoptera arizonana TaxID=38151 RepID=A0A1B6DZL8_9HEMI
MDIIEFGSSLNFDDVFRIVKPSSACQVLFYHGKIPGDNEISNDLKGISPEIMKSGAEKVCKTIREKWDSIQNILIIQRKNEEEIMICLTQNENKKISVALDFAVDFMYQLWKRGFHQSIEYDHPKEDSMKQNVDNKIESNNNMVQIQATSDQINKRIESFIKRKREQVNVSNVKDFCLGGNENKTCCRIDAVLCRRKETYTMRHIQVRRVVNDYGPQIRTEPIKDELSQLEETNHSNDELFKFVDPFSNFKTAQNLGKPFKFEKRTFTIADLDNKLDILKRRMLL